MCGRKETHGYLVARGVGCVGDRALCIKILTPILLMYFGQVPTRKTQTPLPIEREFKTELVSQGIQELRRPTGKDEITQKLAVSEDCPYLWD